MRPSLDVTMLDIASVLASRASCQKRSVGCVLVDSRDHIIGTGYNGKARGLPNCHEKPCESSTCEGVHAEINALLQADAEQIAVAYVSCFPCWHCIKALLNTSCWRIVVPKQAFMDMEQARAHALWLGIGRQIVKL